jgi:hypothetical protein
VVSKISIENDEMTSSAARAACAVFAAFLLIGTAPSAQTRINTPFQVISLWSEDMVRYLIGERQPACSGEKLADCKRINPGVCDATVDVAFGNAFRGVDFPWGSPNMQTATGDPRGFRLFVSNAGYSWGTHPVRVSSDEGSLELKFECATSDRPEDCPTGMFHLGLLRGVEVRTPYGELLFDLVRQSRVHPEGRIVVSLDEAVRKVLYAGTQPFYRVRAAAECFLVPAVPVDWILPVYDGPSVTSTPLGAVIARVTPLDAIGWIYRTNGGEEISFEPDWVQSDSGYHYLMEQTVVDRRGDWVQLPPRPFSQAVWLQLPVRNRSAYDGEPGLHRLEPGPIYRLSKAVTARPKDDRGTIVFKDEDTLVVVAIHDRVLEIRKDEEFDSPCAGDDHPPADRKRQTFLVNAEEFYTADLHLQVTLAYPKGC